MPFVLRSCVRCKQYPPRVAPARKLLACGRSITKQSDYFPVLLSTGARLRPAQPVRLRSPSDSRRLGPSPQMLRGAKRQRSPFRTWLHQPHLEHVDHAMNVCLAICPSRSGSLLSEATYGMTDKSRVYRFRLEPFEAIEI